MIKGLHTIKHLILILFILFPISAFSIEVMNEKDLDSVSASSGITVFIPELRYTNSLDHFAIGGDDGLGIPEAPDGAWFILNSTRVITLDLSGTSFDIDCISVGRDDTSYSSDLRTALFNNVSEDSMSVARIDFGETNFYSFSNDAILTLKFGNNKEGQKTGESGVTTPNLFTEEIARFQVDGSTMTINSDNAKMYVFAHPDGNFQINEP